MNCLGESSSLENSLILKGTARTDEAANWYIGRNASGARLVSPRSANPKVGQRSSRYGFYLENKLDDISIVAGSSRNARDGNKLTSNDGRHLFFRRDRSVPGAISILILILWSIGPRKIMRLIGIVKMT